MTKEKVVTGKIAEEIKVGDIVTIQLNPKKYPENKFQGKQGEVMIIKKSPHPDGPIGVKFPSWYGSLDTNFFERCSSYVADNFFNHKSIIHFEKYELRVDEGWLQPEISDEQLCNLLFGRTMWHTRYILKTPFIPGHDKCMHEQCTKYAILRIQVNCWGAVSDYDVCSKHAEYHGCNCDGFPRKK